MATRRCDHRWHYEQGVYAPPPGLLSDSLAVHRQCIDCGLHQMAVTHGWRRPYKGYKLPDYKDLQVVG